MAHHKRKRRKLKVSSDWVYPQIQKGLDKRGRYSTARWVARANDQLKDGGYKWYTR